MSKPYLSFMRRRFPCVSFAIDSLWSWVLAVIASLYLANAVGIKYSLGVFFDGWMRKYETTEATLIWIQSSAQVCHISIHSRSVFSPICPSVWLSIRLSVRPSISPLIRPSFRLSMDSFRLSLNKNVPLTISGLTAALWSPHHYFDQICFGSDFTRGF